MVTLISNRLAQKHFLWMAWKKNHKSYLWIPRVSTNDCKKEYCAEIASSTRKWCASTINSIVPDNFDMFMKGKPDYTREKLLEKIPKRYHSIIDIFMKRNTDTFSEHWEEDHTIWLEEGKSPPFVKNYRPLLDQENNIMIKYIQEHLGKRFICPSSSVTAAPVLLVKKPDRGLRFCVDYCALNAVTIKNWYFISFINKTLRKLAHVICFTKLDIIAVFNKMRMKEGQE